LEQVEQLVQPVTLETLPEQPLEQLPLVVPPEEQELQ